MKRWINTWRSSARNCSSSGLSDNSGPGAAGTTLVESGSTPRPTAGIAAGVATLLADAAAARLDAAGPGLMAEVFVTRLLGRDEFRRHCDRYRTRDAILANLR